MSVVHGPVTSFRSVNVSGAVRDIAKSSGASSDILQPPVLLSQSHENVPMFVLTRPVALSDSVRRQGGPTSPQSVWGRLHQFKVASFEQQGFQVRILVELLFEAFIHKIKLLVVPVVGGAHLCSNSFDEVDIAR